MTNEKKCAGQNADGDPCGKPAEFDEVNMERAPSYTMRLAPTPVCRECAESVGAMVEKDCASCGDSFDTNELDSEECGRCERRAMRSEIAEQARRY